MSTPGKNIIGSGVDALDTLLGGLHIGDNVLWYDDAGSLASIFCMEFIRESLSRNSPLIYVSFDRSPKNLLDKLGNLAESQNLILVDCFTNGKGDGSDIFTRFYEKDGAQWPYQIVMVKEPFKPEKLTEAINGLQGSLKGHVRYVFESLTGMQDLWGGEDQILKFYTHSCPRLYELETVAYWIVEKGAHSTRLKAHINQIAQVAMDLSIKRGKSALTILKAEKRGPHRLNQPYSFWSDGDRIVFDSKKRASGKVDLGLRIKEFRTRQGLSQKEMAKLVGVTPSTISQVESNLIYPSLPALVKMAEILSVDMGSFFMEGTGARSKTVFSGGSQVNVHFEHAPRSVITGKMLAPVDFSGCAEPFLVEIKPGKSLNAHFFTHKGEEFGYLLTGRLEVMIGNEEYKLKAGDLVYLMSETPSLWKNPGSETAKILWAKIHK